MLGNFYFLKNKANSFNILSAHELTKSELKNLTPCSSCSNGSSSLPPSVHAVCHMTLQSLTPKTWGPFSHPLVLGLPCDLLWSTAWGKCDGMLVLRLCLKKAFVLLLALTPPPSILEYKIHMEHSLAVPVIPANVSQDLSVESTSRFVSQPRSSQVPSQLFQKNEQYLFALCHWWDFMTSCCSAFWYNLYF